MIQDCQQCDDLLDAYLASELLVETTDQVLRHLAGCARCRREARNRAHLRRLLSRVRRVEEVPSGLTGRVLKRIEEDMTSVRETRSRVPHEAGERPESREPYEQTAVRGAGLRARGGRHRPRRSGASRAARAAQPPPARPRADRLPRSSWRHVTAGAAAVMVATLVALGWWHETPLSAAELLRQSSDVERAAASHDAVVHRVMRLEVRTLPAGTLVGRQRIEVWQSTAARVRAKRAFDEAHRLMAGEWTRADGSAAVYYRGEPPRVATPEAAARPRLPVLLGSEEPWRMDLSATDVRAFAGDARPATVVAGPAAYVITYRDIALSDEQTAALTVTLSRPQLRPIRQTVVVAGPSGQREYRLEEERFSELRREDIRAAVFEPEAELLGPAPSHVATIVPTVVPAPKPPPVAIHEPEPPMDPGLEVAALYQLHQAGACLFDHAVVRNVDGRALYIDAVAEASRKPVLLAALKPFEGDPHVHVSIADANAAAMEEDEPAPDGALPSAVVPAPAPAVASRTATPAVVPGTPAYARVSASLRQAVLDRLGDAREPDDMMRREIDTASMELARRVLDRADDARRHAEALEALVARGAGNPAWRADLNATAIWLSMIRDHGRGFRQQLALLRDDLCRIFPSPAIAPAEPAPGTHNMTDLTATAQMLASAASAQQARVRAAFAPAENPDAAPVIDADFWAALVRAERLAASLDEPWILD